MHSHPRALQVDIELAVGEFAHQGVRHVDGERGLAHTADAADGGDRRRVARQEHLCEPLDLRGSAGEVGDVGR